MNRNNIWIHISIAVVLITLAAVLGQIRLWENSLRASKTASQNSPRATTAPPTYMGEIKTEPEVLVRFKPGVPVSEIKRIAAANNDLMADEFEFVRGWTEIDDLDNADAETTAKQYAAMSDVVDYAEPNFRIDTDPIESMSSNPPAAAAPLAG